MAQMGGDHPPRTIVVGSRRSQLAMIQTRIVIEQLKYHNPDFEFSIKNIDTVGDNILDKPLAKIGEKALFTRELEEELLLGNIDIIVHSLKDLPTSLPDKCCVGAILKREDPSDCIVLRKTLQHSAQNDLRTIIHDSDIKTFGTSSVRRIAQLKSISPSIVVKDVRGNLNTRIDKLDNHHKHGYDCLVLATSGLIRAGFGNRISARLDQWYHAVSQGSLGVECRTGDLAVIGMLEPLVDEKSCLECTAERVLMKCLEGGCSVPIGVRTSWPAPNRLTLETKVLSPDGKQSVEAAASRDLNYPLSEITFDLNDQTDIHIGIGSIKMANSVLLGREVAEKMINMGVKAILEK